MKLILFGTGDYYHKYSKWFYPKDIVALADNDNAKQGTVIDGYEVISPAEICKRKFDWIIILSVHEKEIREQLISLGVALGKIVGYAFLQQHKDLLKRELFASLVVSGKRITEYFEPANTQNRILLLSHTLDYSGATLALYYAAKVLLHAEYDVVFASWNDGQLKNILLSDGIPVIIDPNFEIHTANEISWIGQFDRIICNTMNFYYFLSDRNRNAKYIWWLHDPILFYETLDTDVFSMIDVNNLTICAAGRMAEDAIKKYIPAAGVYQLLYGIPPMDHKESDNVSKRKHPSKLEIAVIANVQNYKGQDILIDALGMLTVRERNFIHARIVGNDSSVFATELKKKAAVFGDVVDFVGPIGRDEIGNILETIDLLICPSRVDTMSVSCGEAMQRGIPCLMSKSVGMAEYVTDRENGIIFQNENAQNLSEKIKWCLGNRRKLEQIGRNGQKIYESFFSMDVFGERLLSIVESSYGIKK